MTDEQYAELREFVRNHPAAIPVDRNTHGSSAIYGGIPIDVDYDAEESFVRLLYSPPRVELSGDNYADLHRRLNAEPI